MKKLLLFFALATAFLTARAYDANYYKAMDGKQKEALKSAAKQCVQNHTRLVYTDLPTYWQYTDVYPELVNGCKRWWDMYSDNIYLIKSGQTALRSFSANKMQREHSIPKSWWKKNGDVEYTPAYTDLWNLYPSDGKANQAKLNYAFGECKTTSFDNGVSKIGPAKSGFGGGSGNVFEPGDEYKGDFARSIFYMAVVYDELPWVYNYMFSADSSWPTLREWAYNMLLDWARRDPVSQKEKDRNNAVENAQGNRNPFIDFPELAEYIWGTRTSQTFYIDKQGGQVTPPITGDPAVIAPVNGEALDFSEVAVGQSVSAQLQVKAQNLKSNLSVRITGQDRAMFRVSASSIPALDLNLGDTYLLNVIYSPTSEGIHTANLTLYDGGLPMSQQINVTLQGQAFPVPNLEKLTATPATNITENAYTANWEPTAQVIDFYVVTRVRYVGNDTESDVLSSDTNSLQIEGYDPDYTETYSVQSSRLGFLSEPSNTIIVGNSGVDGVMASQPLRIGRIEGGFNILLDTEHTGLRVYDMTGRLVLLRERISGGECFQLPYGVYIITDDQTRKPIKFMSF